MPHSIPLHLRRHRVSQATPHKFQRKLTSPLNSLELAIWLVLSISSAALYPCRNEPRWARILPVAPHRVHSLDHSHRDDYGGGRHPFGHRGRRVEGEDPELGVCVHFSSSPQACDLRGLDTRVVAMLAAMLVLWAVVPAHKI